jgi:hypothetical protein
MNKKQSILIFALLIFWNYSISQKLNFIKYFNVANEAEYMLNTGNPKSAKKHLLSLEKKFKQLKPREYFYLGVLHYIEGDSLKGNLCFKRSATKYHFKPTDELNNVKNVFPEFSISNYSYNLLKQEEQKEIEKAKALFNRSINDSIVYYFGIDEALRENDVSFMFDSNEVSSSILRLFKEISIIELHHPDADYYNQLGYLNYLKRQGVPDFYVYGDFFLSIFQHVDDDRIFNDYDTFLFNELKKGAIWPFYYAMMVDRKQYYDGKPTIYGHYGAKNKTVEKSVINKSRLAIGHSIYYFGASSEFPNFRKPDYTN